MKKAPEGFPPALFIFQIICRFALDRAKYYTNGIEDYPVSSGKDVGLKRPDI
ncbi:hypothetical protein N826_07035 [Skermanella aerolata KACC 11604]|nr:hypothetical protein N826_07035 [Skermanella aerolata KACC 11604]